MSRPCLFPPPSDLALHDARATPPKPMPVPANTEGRRTGIVARADLDSAARQPDRLARATAPGRGARCHECRAVAGAHRIDCSQRPTDRVEET